LLVDFDQRSLFELFSYNIHNRRSRTYMSSTTAQELTSESQALDATIRTALGGDGKITGVMGQLEERLVSSTGR
jgi:hypothetical protein